MMMVARSDVTSCSAALILCSVAASIAAVESSNTMIWGCSMMLLAIDSLCRCPPDRDTPRSPMVVAYPVGSLST